MLDLTSFQPRDRVVGPNRCWPRLSLVFVLLAASLSVLTLGAVVPLCNSYVAAQSNLRDVGRFQDMLRAVNRVSAERGPSNAVIGAEHDSQGEARLAQFRQDSDRALARVADAVDEASLDDRNGDGDLPRTMLGNATQALADARREVDRLKALPLPERSERDIARTIAGMFRVVDALQEVVILQTRNLERRNPALAGLAVVGRAASDMREDAGRLGSLLVPYLVSREPLAPADVERIVRAQGRLTETWSLIRGQVAFERGSPMATAGRDVETMFFGDGFALIASLMAEGRTRDGYTLTAGDLTRAYVPLLKPLEEVREAYLARMLAIFVMERDAALVRLVVIASSSLVLAGLMVGLIGWLRGRVLQPLLHVRSIAVSLSEGQPFAVDPWLKRIPEFRQVFDALSVIWQKLREREAAMSKLIHQADTDPLTGLWNRGALDRFALTERPGRPHATHLVLIDLDHFKAINDTYGHQAGDTVLRTVAARMRATLHKRDVLARLGGEEFAVLLHGVTTSLAADVAERLREAISDRPVPLSDGQTLVDVRASFGVARGELGTPGWDHLLGAADEALYRAKASGRNCVRLEESEPEPMRLAG